VFFFSFGQYIVCVLRLTASDYPFVIFKLFLEIVIFVDDFEIVALETFLRCLWFKKKLRFWY